MRRHFCSGPIRPIPTLGGYTGIRPAGEGAKDDGMTVKFQITFAEFTRARTAHVTARRGRRWVSSLFLLALTAWVIVLVVTHKTPEQLGLHAVNLNGPNATATFAAHAVPLQERLIPSIPWLLLAITMIRTLIATFRRPRARYIDVSHDLVWQDWLDRSIPAVMIVAAMFCFAWLSAYGTDGEHANRSAGAALASVGTSIAWMSVAGFFSLMLNHQLPRWIWHGSASQKRDKTVHAAGDRLVVSDELSVCIYQWPAVVRLVESADLFLIYPTEQSYQIVPKRAFAAAGEVDAFRVTAAEWELNQTHAFPVTPLPVQETAAAAIAA
jgi:hypothetical protein